MYETINNIAKDEIDLDLDHFSNSDTICLEKSELVKLLDEVYRQGRISGFRESE